jgi:cell division inhibitor SepF
VGVFQRMKVWLGLADDYDPEFDDEYEDDSPQKQAAPADDAGLARPQAYTSPHGGKPTVRRVDREPDLDRARDARPGSFDSMARGFSAGRDDDGAAEYAPPPRPSYDRPERPLASVSQPQVQMAIVEPRAFSEAQSIADKFKAGTPVIMNLGSADADLAKRLLDFASGLTYGLDGGLQKVSEKVFMLTPRNVDVSAEDRRRLKDRGLFSLDQ